MLGAHNLLRRLQSSGVSPDEILVACGADTIEEPRHGISPAIWNVHHLLDAVARIAPAGIGFELGQHWRPEDYEPFGGALRHCTTLREVSAVLKRYQTASRQTHFFADSAVGQDWQIEFAASAPFGPGVMIVMEELLSRTKCETANYLGLSDLPFKRVELAYAAPDHAKRYEDLFQCRVLFGRPRTILTIDREYLYYPLPSCDDATDIEESEDILREMSVQQRVAMAILETLVFHPGTYPSMQRVADMFDTSVSTVKRWLSRDAMNYRVLVDIVRREHVSEYLAFSTLAPKEIAYRLGFTNVNNFRRAFNRWMGMTPSEFRTIVSRERTVLH